MPCDKCNLDVHPANDASHLELIVKKIRTYGVEYREEDADGWIDTALLTSRPRHLLPVVVDGAVVCDGSPSRAQYIEGQPRDNRGFPYFPEREAEIRAAYARLLIEHPTD